MIIIIVYVIDRDNISARIAKSHTNKRHDTFNILEFIEFIYI